jgi:hypothetical protein
MTSPFDFPINALRRWSYEIFLSFTWLEKVIQMFRYGQKFWNFGEFPILKLNLVKALYRRERVMKICIVKIGPGVRLQAVSKVSK